MPNIPEFSTQELLRYEKEVLGIYLSGHPLDKVSSQMDILTTHKAIEFAYNNEDEVSIKDNEKVTIAGMIVSQKIQLTKTGDKMAFIEVEDLSGIVNCIVFPNIYKQLAQIPENEPVIINGRVSFREEEEAKVVIFEILVLNSLIKDTLVLELDKTQRTATLRQNLLEIFQRNKGNTRVIVKNKEDQTTKAFPAKYNIEISADIINSLGEIIPKECIIVQKYA